MHEKVSLVASQSWVDSLGASVSIGCAIQCTLFPLLIGVLPLVGLGFLTGDGVEKFFLVTSIILAVGSLSWGFRHHKNLYVFLFLIAGLLLIFTGRVWVEENSEISFVVSGTLVLAAGHLLNRRLCQLCVVCEASEKIRRVDEYGLMNWPFGGYSFTAPPPNLDSLATRQKRLNFLFDRRN